jgi:CRISPR-associated exonuclease Cas4
MSPLIWFGIAAALLLLLAGAALWWTSRRLWAQSGLPAGDVVYSDTGAWEQPAEPLRSARYGLVGKPDYLVRQTINGQSVLIPVEVKSRTRPPRLLHSHVLQLATYCLLVEDIHGTAPPHGLLRYADGTVQVPYTPALRQEVLAAAAAIRTARQATDVARSHQEPPRCAGCGYRDACGEQALVR